MERQRRVDDAIRCWRCRGSRIGSTQVADELTNQYVVQYGRPEQLIPPEKVQVTVKRQGLTVRAKTRAADK